MGHNANDSLNDLQKKYKEVCCDLNLDKASADEAWQSFQRIGNNYSLEGEKMHWLACALYVSCRKGVTPTVGGGHSGFVKGNCVSLTRLLRSCSLSLVMFFNKMKKWSDMASLPHEMREKLDHLERNFCVTTVIFNKYKPIFMHIFKEPVVSSTKPKSKKQAKKLHVTSTEVFSFCWTLFTHVKSQYTAISDDLVNSYHLLLACIDFCYANALTAENVKDLLNSSFSDLPSNFTSSDFKFNPDESVCIINTLIKQFEGLSRDAMGIKEHWWKPCLKRMVERKELKCRSPQQLIGFLDSANFEFNYKKINQLYDEYVLNFGDFDERIFLCENADQELGTPETSEDLAERMSAKQTLKQHMEESKILTPTTPLSNRHYLKSRDAFPMTPVSSATQTVTLLHNLLRDRKDEPSEELLEIFEECSKNPKLSIAARIQDMGIKFMEAYVQPSNEDTSGNGEVMVIQNNEFAQKRLQLVVTLYYKSLENIMKREKRRLNTSPEKLAEGLTNLLTTDMFHVSLFACSAEIVLFSYNSKRTFPWIIDVFSDFKDIKFQAFTFYRVIELLIRDEDGLSRSVVKHLNSIEEKIIESMAWKSQSALWESVKSQGVPSCQDVALSANPTDGVPPSPLSSVKRLTSQAFASPVPGAAGDRFVSPINTPAKRRLFEANGASTASGTINHQESNVYQISASSASEIRFIQVPYVQVPLSSTAASSNESSVNRMDPPKPKTGALGLFFRKVYNLAWLRMRDLCDRLDINGDDLKRKIWTCFELSLRNHTHLMRDRHLDQLLMCAIYSMCKVTQAEVTFTDIMKSYRLQPQARSHIYRSVLISSRQRRNSNGSENSKNSSSPSPVEEQKEAIRSSSTLPIPAPNSQPPTPTRLAGSGSQFDYGEERGDLIMFYNQVYVPEMKDFIIKFSVSSDPPSLSPLPRLAANPVSPYRRISSKHSLFVSPLKTNSNYPASPSRPMSFSVGRSPAKDLQAINRRMKMSAERRTVSKRIFQDDTEPDQNKRTCIDGPAIRSKIQNIFSERSVIVPDANSVIFKQ